jgi:hypothetical protein
MLSADDAIWMRNPPQCRNCGWMVIVGLVDRGPLIGLCGGCARDALAEVRRVVLAEQELRRTRGR